MFPFFRSPILQRCHRRLRPAVRTEKLFLSVLRIVDLFGRLLLAFVFSTFSAGLPAQVDALAAKSHRAREAMDMGQFEEAVVLYTALVHAIPGNVGLHMDLGLALHSAGRYREAITQFQIVLKHQPNSGPAWLMLGLARQKLGEPAKAIDPLERALRADPLNKIAQLEVADALLSTGQPKRAIVYFEKLVELEPNNAKAWQGLGLSYASLSRRIFAELEKIAPRSPYRDVLLARSFPSRSRYRNAFYYERQALAKAPHLPGIHADLAEIYRNTAHPDWAAVEEERERRLPLPECSSNTLECEFRAGHYRQLLETDRRNASPELYYWQARAAEELSLQAFARLAQMPPSAEIHELMAKAYRLQGIYRLAVKECEEALKLAPGDQRLEKQLAESFWLDRDYKSAQPLLEKLLQKEPDSAELNHELGDTLLNTQGPEKAIPFLEGAVRSSPKLRPAQISLARAYLRVSRAEEAIPHLKAALPDEKTGTVLYQLAQAYKRTGRDDLARQAMRKFEETSRSRLARTQRINAEQEITPP